MLFEDKYEFLGNFYPASIEYEGVIYPTTEHAFQAQKALSSHDAHLIAAAQTPGQAKGLARKTDLRPDWEDVKEEIMKEVVREKFSIKNHPQLAQKLLDTGDEYLVETTLWHDNEWGNCMCPKCCDIEGKNKLGIILMAIRDELRATAEKPVDK